MKNESQYGLLLLQRYLYEHTDDQHPASVADILAFWQEHGIQAGRKSVYSAIEVLQSSGMDIVCVKSTQNRYFVGERLFELPELKLLVDAVESSRFITAKKSERLIEKLGKLTSESHARQLDRHIYMEGTAKPENECIYYSVDEIHNAIQEKRQITFQYYEYTPQKEKILKHNGYRYQFSPYALIWSRDCYYAVGWSEKHGKTGTVPGGPNGGCGIIQLRQLFVSRTSTRLSMCGKYSECTRTICVRWSCCAITRSCAA